MLRLTLRNEARASLAPTSKSPGGTCLFLSLDCRQNLVPVRLPHRYHKTHQVHLQVQQQSEVTILHQETGAIRQKTETKFKRGITIEPLGDRLRDLPYWSQGFKVNLEETELPAPAHISHDSDSERPTKVAPKQHHLFTHFPKDGNCEVWLRTKITSALCRRRSGVAVPRAEKFGDLITADHKVCNEQGESRNGHRYAVVVQDLATEWTQSYQCKTKTSQETEKSLQKFLEPSHKTEAIYTDNSLELLKIF